MLSETTLLFRNQVSSTMTENKIEIIPALKIPLHLAGEIQAKFAYVDERIFSAEVAHSGEKIILCLNKPVSASEKMDLEEKIQRVVRSMVQGTFQPRVEILEDHLDRPHTYHIDPTEALLASGEIKQETNGVFALGPLVSQLVEYFETRFVELANTFKAQPYRFPVLIPARYLERVNYFHAFPQSLSFATHLRGDLDVIDHFAQHTACDEHGNLTTQPDSFAGIQTLLSPAVCYHLYFGLADQALPEGKVIATAVGNCFRYESINLVSLERLWNFTMREVIFVGSKDFVLENRELARQRMSTVFEEIGLAYRVESANDPFFIGDFRKQAAFQSAFQLKFEIRAALPFKNSTLAVGSYNYHQDFFGKHLNISLPDGAPAHTGCVAFGLERMAYAYLAQFGLDPEKWPIYDKVVVK
jgi:seryl-tRNA synthetase